MRFTAVLRIINNERGLAIWNSRWKYSAYYLRFQREFDIYKNVGGSIIHFFVELGFQPQQYFMFAHYQIILSCAYMIHSTIKFHGDLWRTTSHIQHLLKRASCLNSLPCSLMWFLSHCGFLIKQLIVSSWQSIGYLGYHVKRTWNIQQNSRKQTKHLRGGSNGWVNKTSLEHNAVHFVAETKKADKYT